MLIHSAKYVQSAPDVAHCPKSDLPEFAFIGRSNVGKSSLINLITNRNGLALTSSKPGKTRTINHFLVNEEWFVVDLPGYGYAYTSQLQRGLWMRNTEQYLLKRETLLNVFQLVDANIPPQKKDLEFSEWLGRNSIPFSIVFTKTDKPKPVELNENIESFKKEMLKVWAELPPIFITSADKKVGSKELLTYIEKCLKKYVKKG